MGSSSHITTMLLFPPVDTHKMFLTLALKTPLVKALLDCVRTFGVLASSLRTEGEDSITLFFYLYKEAETD